MSKVCPRCGGNILPDTEDGEKCLQCCRIPPEKIDILAVNVVYEPWRSYGNDYGYASPHQHKGYRRGYHRPRRRGQRL